MTEKIRIVLADDEPFVRKGLCYIIEMQDDMEIVGECKDGKEAIKIALETVPDMVIMDIQMPDISGIMATKKHNEYITEHKSSLIDHF